MTREEAKREIVTNASRYLKPDHSHKGYICPICGSGSGKKGTGITTKDHIHYTCWAGCFTNCDIIDIIGMENGLTDYNDKLERACDEYGIDYQSLEADYNLSLARARADFSDQNESEPVAQNQAKNGQNTEYTHNEANTDNTDYVEYFRERASHRSESDYLLKRGISERVQELFLIGFDPAWRSPKAVKNGKNPPATPRVIIPTSRYSYIARDTRAELTDQEKQFSKMKEGSLSLFNLKALEKLDSPLFIVEGEIDALSIIEVGYKAVALGSTTNYKKLLDVVKNELPEKPLLIALDEDKSGQETAGKLLAGCKNLGVEAYKVNICLAGCKDANESLVKDREAFTQLVTDALETAQREKDREKQEYLKTSTYNYLGDFINGISGSVNTPCYPTGFKGLDDNLDGGLYEGLYIVGAISSLGKTTLALQIADQIARAGNDVLIFSLEMARNELIAKSISRLTAELAIERDQPIENAKTTRGITVNKFYMSYSQEERDLINDGIERYADYAKHIFISEGMGNIGANEVRDTIAKHILFTGSKPVVVIDYLQILAGYIDPDHPNRILSDKQSMDKNILELKRISRDYKLPLIAISSFNRDNYNMAVNMSAFKESGSIEYGSDILIGLQLEGAGENGFDVDQAKEKNPRRIEAKILKNRNGKTGGLIKMEYYPQYNYFREDDRGLKEWQKTHKEKPKQTKRGKQELSLSDAFTATANKDGKTTVKAMAEYLDITSSATVRARIKEYGGYEIEKGTGIVSRCDFMEISPLEAIPFEETSES